MMNDVLMMISGSWKMYSGVLYELGLPKKIFKSDRHQFCQSSNQNDLFWLVNMLLWLCISVAGMSGIKECYCMQNESRLKFSNDDLWRCEHVSASIQTANAAA